MESNYPDIKKSAQNVAELFANLKNENHQFSNERVELRRKLQTQDEIIGKMDSNAVTLNQEVGMMKNQLAEFNRIATEDRDLLSSQEQKIKEAQDIISSQKEELALLNDKQGNLSSKYKEYQETMLKQEAIISTAQKTVKELSSQNLNYEDKLENLEKLQEQYETLQQESEGLQKTNAILLSDNKKLIKEVRNYHFISEDITKKNLELISKGNDIKKSKEIVMVLQSEILSLEKKLKEKNNETAQIFDFKKELLIKDEQLENIERQANEKNELIIDLKDVISNKDVLIQDNNETNEQLQNEIEALRRMIDKLEELGKGLKENIRKKIVAINTIENSYFDKKKEMKELEKALAAKDQSIKEAMAISENKQSEIENLIIQKTQLLTEQNQSKDAVNLKMAAFDNAMGTLEVIKAEVKNSVNSIKKLQDALDLKETEVVKITANYTMLERLVGQKNEQIYSLNEKIEQQNAAILEQNTLQETTQEQLQNQLQSQLHEQQKQIDSSVLRDIYQNIVMQIKVDNVIMQKDMEMMKDAVIEAFNIANKDINEAVVFIRKMEKHYHQIQIIAQIQKRLQLFSDTELLIIRKEKTGKLQQKDQLVEKISNIIAVLENN